MSRHIFFSDIRKCGENDSTSWILKSKCSQWLSVLCLQIICKFNIVTFKKFNIVAFKSLLKSFIIYEVQKPGYYLKSFPRYHIQKFKCRNHHPLRKVGFYCWFLHNAHQNKLPQDNVNFIRSDWCPFSKKGQKRKILPLMFWYCSAYLLISVTIRLIMVSSKIALMSLNCHPLQLRKPQCWLKVTIIYLFSSWSLYFSDVYWQ